jgi:hypothetical protein
MRKNIKVKKDKNKKTEKRLSPRKIDGMSFQYVTMNDIVDFHGEKWANKWGKAFGIGTVGVVTENGKKVFAYYYHDYKRFADLVDNGTPTYWD